MTKKHRMGNLFQRGNVWWLKYMIEGRLIRQSLETTDEDKAEAKRQEIMRPFMASSRADALAVVQAKLSDANTQAQDAKDAANPPLAIADAWGAYLKATNRPDSSDAMIYRNASIWKRFTSWLATDNPGKTFMLDIDAATTTAYAQRLTVDQVTASTFNQHIGFLRLLWRCLAEQTRGNGNPWQTITKKRLQRLQHRHKAVTAEQFDNLLKAADSADVHDLLFVLGWTGQRLVDGIMLRWDTVDFKRKVITLHPVKTARTGKAVQIPIFPQLADMLQKRRNMVGGAQVFPELATDYERDSSAISKRIQKAFTRAGLTPHENLPGVKRAVAFYGAHSLRHFYVTQAMAAGISGAIVKRITGHTSDAMLEGYEHIDAAMIGKLAERIGNGTAPTPPALPAPDIRAQVKALAESMTGKNWKAKRDELLKLC